MDITQYFSKNLLTGKTVCVTGGGSGINLGIAKNFAAVGAKVAICGRTPEKLDAAAEDVEAGERTGIGGVAVVHHAPEVDYNRVVAAGEIAQASELADGGMILEHGHRWHSTGWARAFVPRLRRQEKRRCVIVRRWRPHPPHHPHGQNRPP